MRYYIVYDSRAEYDEDEASIYESIGEMPTEESAKDYFRNAWSGSDGVLFAYDCDDEDVLINGERILM